MTKVCHMTSAHRSNDVRIFQKECVSLAAAGYEVYLVAPGDSREEKGVKVVGVGARPERRLERMTAFAKKVYRQALSLDCDIYHFHDPELLPYGWKLRRKGKKVIFDSHEFYGLQLREKYYLPAVLRKAIARVYMAYERYVCLRIDAVVEVCTVDGEDYFQNRAAKRIMLTNVPILKPDPAGNRSEEKKEGLTLIYAGSLTKARGIGLLAEISKETGTRSILCGTFQPPQYQEEILREYGDCLDYRGQLSMEELEKAYQESDVGFSVLSDTGQYAHLDTLATKTYEYMMYGLPVITSDFPYYQKSIKEYGYGICVNPDGIAQALSAVQYLLEHPEERKRMGENGRRAVEQEYNWEMEQDKLLQLYRDVAACEGGRNESL